MTEVADLAPAAPSKGLFECLSCCSPAPVKEEEPAPVEEPPKEEPKPAPVKKAKTTTKPAEKKKGGFLRVFGGGKK
eukprot:CAMPEP_0118684702 /NCGR_PEP_ID=MMETSP0800-20121206/6803_1 /TAXON_ID=210618 ORGANISM="Striatella unipunctata, Strain CCMP2910" /NCGR_SAMPLE_ID=MMETSP0800 /ASSEMBLY_ACC=CAM_ASM_000638 /LENGTH=75 /DNA_ID=CAMNT_0006581463 /DNA_START=36 /DNA_END=263 /DNA_ORIENTATION=+